MAATHDNTAWLQQHNNMGATHDNTAWLQHNNMTAAQQLRHMSNSFHRGLSVWVFAPPLYFIDEIRSIISKELP